MQTSEYRYRMTQVLSDRLLACCGKKMALLPRDRAVGFLTLGPGHEQEYETDNRCRIGNEKVQYEPAGPAAIAAALRGDGKTVIAPSLCDRTGSVAALGVN